jgi:hypothetical protein
MHREKSNIYSKKKNKKSEISKKERIDVITNFYYSIKKSSKYRRYCSHG